MVNLDDLVSVLLVGAKDTQHFFRVDKSTQAENDRISVDACKITEISTKFDLNISLKALKEKVL
jgi:hypothetical protein